MLGSDPGQLVAQEADVFDVWGHRWLTGAARLSPARVSVRLTVFTFRGGVFQRSKQWYPLQQQQTGRRPRSHQVCVNNRYLHTHHLALSLPCCVSMVCLWTTAGSGLLEPHQTCASPPTSSHFKVPGGGDFSFSGTPAWKVEVPPTLSTSLGSSGWPDPAVVLFIDWGCSYFEIDKQKVYVRM